MYALYQSGGPLLGVGETIDAACEDATLEEALLVNDLGQPVTLDEYEDFTRLYVRGIEIPGNLYLRRCTPALFHAAIDTPPARLRYIVRQDGAVTLHH